MQNMKHVQSSIDNNTKVAITAEQMFMNANGFNIDLYGSKIGNDGLFQNKINVEVVEIISSDKIKMQFWERGAGRTLSCGSGILASFYACYKSRKCNSSVKVALSHGNVTASIDKNKLSIIGEAEVSFLGEFLNE